MGESVVLPIKTHCLCTVWLMSTTEHRRKNPFPWQRNTLIGTGILSNIYIYIYIYIYNCIYIYMHIYIYVYIRAYALFRKSIVILDGKFI